jgi:hypothetical protein
MLRATDNVMALWLRMTHLFSRASYDVMPHIAGATLHQFMITLAAYYARAAIAAATRLQCRLLFRQHATASQLLTASYAPVSPRLAES